MPGDRGHQFGNQPIPPVEVLVVALVEGAQAFVRVGSRGETLGLDNLAPDHLEFGEELIYRLEEMGRDTRADLMEELPNTTALLTDCQPQPRDESGEVANVAGDSCGDRLIAVVTGHFEPSEVDVVIVVYQHRLRSDRSMNNAMAVGKRQGASNLVHDLPEDLGPNIAASQRLGESSPAQPLADQVGTGGITPVVMELDDVGVIEVSDQVGFSLESGDETGLIDQVRPHNPDRHLATH